MDNRNHKTQLDPIVRLLILVDSKPLGHFSIVLVEAYLDEEVDESTIS